MANSLRPRADGARFAIVPDEGSDLGARCTPVGLSPRFCSDQNDQQGDGRASSRGYGAEGLGHLAHKFSRRVGGVRTDPFSTKGPRLSELGQCLFGLRGLQ